MPPECVSKDFQECLISTFLGIMSILDRNFLVVVDEISQITKFENHDIYQISGVSFYPLDEAPLKKEILNYLNNLKKVPFVYFSNLIKNLVFCLWIVL